MAGGRGDHTPPVQFLPIKHFQGPYMLGVCRESLSSFAKGLRWTVSRQQGRVSSLTFLSPPQGLPARTDVSSYAVTSLLPRRDLCSCWNFGHCKSQIYPLPTWPLQNVHRKVSSKRSLLWCKKMFKSMRTRGLESSRERHAVKNCTALKNLLHQNKIPRTFQGILILTLFKNKNHHKYLNKHSVKIKTKIYWHQKLVDCPRSPSQMKTPVRPGWAVHADWPRDNITKKLSTQVGNSVHISN